MGNVWLRVDWSQSEGGGWERGGSWQTNRWWRAGAVFSEQVLSLKSINSVLPPHTSSRSSGVPLYETHKLRTLPSPHFFNVKSKFKFCSAHVNRSLCKTLFAVRLRLSNFLECAERHGITERSAQMQQHPNVSHFSRSFCSEFRCPWGSVIWHRLNLRKYFLLNL